MKECIPLGMIALELSPGLGGCGYTHSSVEGVKITSGHIQEIKIGLDHGIDWTLWNSWALRRRRRRPPGETFDRSMSRREA